MDNKNDKKIYVQFSMKPDAVLVAQAKVSAILPSKSTKVMDRPVCRE